MLQEARWIFNLMLGNNIMSVLTLGLTFSLKLWYDDYVCVYTNKKNNKINSFSSYTGNKVKQKK